MVLPRLLQRSIRLKITALVISSTFAALLLSAFAAGYYTVHDYRERKLISVRNQAEIVAHACAPALSFDDTREARRNLELLRSRPGVQQVALYGPDGKLFAAFSPVGEKAAALSPQVAGHRIEGEYITVVYPIVEDGQHLGTLVLKELYEANRRLQTYMNIVVGVMAVALVAAALLSSWLQRAITDPILRLAQTAGRVIERRDFSVRTGRTTDDEIGVLTDAMNRMLTDLELEIEERRSAEDSLRAADRRKDEFLATLAHELRNPLASIRNSVHLMQLKPNDPEVAAGARAIIDRQVIQLIRLIDDLLDVSRLTTGRLSLRRQSIELRQVALNAIEAVEPSAQARRQRFTYRIPPPGLTIDADPARLEQVFLNLLNNSVKFTQTEGKIDFSLEVVGGEMIARVIDNGPGIPSDMLEGIFEMFTQVDRRLDHEASGLGLGLSLSRTLVELHGGTLKAHSAGQDRGAEFVVRIPVVTEERWASDERQDTEGPRPADERQPSEERHPPVDRRPKLGRAEPPKEADDDRPAEDFRSETRTAANGHPLRILVVDDNVDYADSLGVMLKKLGHEVRVEYDGLAGLAAAESFRPDIALVDLGMPKLDGFELARRLRVLPATASTRLIAVTGWGEAIDRQRGREAGFDEHVVKPLGFDRLIGLLDQTKQEKSRSPS